MRALDAARERAYSFTQAASQPQPAPPPSGAARPPRPLFWPLDGRDVASPSPPPERPSRAQGAPDLDATAVAGDVERAMWGSPTPFYPSPLPLPLVQEMNSLEARSKVFGGAKKVTARLPRRRTLAGR
ncbi:hypothetical protein BD414DRAFT_490708 [Trametes punicea]|nr:hypothetical protein BD414DRAFT_490708 [Trametes punicea]